MMDEENRTTAENEAEVIETAVEEKQSEKVDVKATENKKTKAGPSSVGNAAAVGMNQNVGNGGKYTWTPYQPGTSYGSAPNGGNAYSAAPGVPVYQNTGYAGDPYGNSMPQPSKKNGIGKGFLVGICGVLGLLVVFASAWLAATIAYMGLDAAARQAAENNKETVVLAENRDTSRTDASVLQNSSYNSLADLVEDVSHSLVTMYNGTEYSDALIVGEDNEFVYIACPYTVVSSRSQVQAIFGKDNKTFIPVLQGTYLDADLAVVKLEKKELDEDTLKEMKIATFGKSSNLQLGDLAIAFGSPMGYYNTPSIGAISGLEREVSITLNNQSLSLEMIQTDAAINSSGVLFNGKGEVVGMTIKISISDSEGIGFAIPAERVLEVVEELIEKGYVKTPYMGFTGYDVMNFYPNGSAESWAEHYHLPAGVLVATVVEGSPAEMAGLQPYDLIIGFNDQEISDFDDLRNWLDECEVGQVVTVEVVRGYVEGEPETQILTLTIGQKPQ